MPGPASPATRHTGRFTTPSANCRHGKRDTHPLLALLGDALLGDTHPRTGLGTPTHRTAWGHPYRTAWGHPPILGTPTGLTHRIDPYWGHPPDWGHPPPITADLPPTARTGHAHESFHPGVPEDRTACRLGVEETHTGKKLFHASSEPGGRRAADAQGTASIPAMRAGVRCGSPAPLRVATGRAQPEPKHCFGRWRRPATGCGAGVSNNRCCRTTGAVEQRISA